MLVHMENASDEYTLAFYYLLKSGVSRNQARYRAHDGHRRSN